MIEISKAAIAEIVRMQTVQDRNTSEFHIGFASGGCDDFYYTIELVDSTSDRVGVASACASGRLTPKAEASLEENRVYDIDGVAVSIDLQQLAYFDNLKLDYSEDLMGGGFRFQNPLATSVCGCGNSFSMSNVEAESERWQLPT
jgi:iron-sulfur cluster assembly protein